MCFHSWRFGQKPHLPCRKNRDNTSQKVGRCYSHTHRTLTHIVTTVSQPASQPQTDSLLLETAPTASWQAATANNNNNWKSSDPLLWFPMISTHICIYALYNNFSVSSCDKSVCLYVRVCLVACLSVWYVEVITTYSASNIRVCTHVSSSADYCAANQRVIKPAKEMQSVAMH